MKTKKFWVRIPFDDVQHSHKTYIILFLNLDTKSLSHCVLFVFSLLPPKVVQTDYNK